MWQSNIIVSSKVRRIICCKKRGYVLKPKKPPRFKRKPSGRLYRSSYFTSDRVSMTVRRIFEEIWMRRTAKALCIYCHTTYILFIPTSMVINIIFSFIVNKYLQCRTTFRKKFTSRGRVGGKGVVTMDGAVGGSRRLVAINRRPSGRVRAACPRPFSRLGHRPVWSAPST